MGSIVRTDCPNPVVRKSFLHFSKETFMPNRHNSVAESQSTQTQRPSRSESQPVSPVNDLMEYVRTYAQQNPEAAALWCLGIGFVLGCKLKFW